MSYSYCLILILSLNFSWKECINQVKGGLHIFMAVFFLVYRCAEKSHCAVYSTSFLPVHVSLSGMQYRLYGIPLNNFRSFGAREITTNSFFSPRRLGRAMEQSLFNPRRLYLVLCIFNYPFCTHIWLYISSGFTTLINSSSIQNSSGVLCWTLE